MKEDWIRIVEAAYDLTGDDQQWLASVAESVRPLLDAGHGIVAYFFDASAAELHIPSYAIAGASERELAFAKATNALPVWRSSELLRATYRSPRALNCSSLFPEAAQRELWAAAGYPEEEPYRHVLILNAADPSHRGCVFGAPSRREARAAMKRTTAWSRVAAHIASGLRLRRRLGAAGAQDAEAVLSPAGTVVHAEGLAKESNARDVLRRAAVAVERARGRLRADDPDAALTLWRGLLDGRWSLVDKFDSDGRRFIVAHRNDLPARGPRLLSDRERQVVSYAALAHSNKLISYELGLSLGSVSTHLRSALAKLGLESRMQLIEIASNLGVEGDLLPR